MKKTYSKADLQKKAQGVFKSYPDADKLFATTDGQFFLDQNRANLHAGAKGKVIEVENDAVLESTETKTGKTLKAEDLIANAKDIETIEAVEAAIVQETEGKNRTTVLAAYDARIDELKADK
ncbi:hypothetical protein BN863_28610 [Formosa agariphila KMM 3901]|uniref:Uncharacterized protein n=1 Tax=Formosa agariphila (strain DSM 15362 / KCTC 12365 / LMG 23005 / KMM 3901 / M-2Alg 35-1) TaxID=1347342 RepID=T2KPZ3_FORAG|nr:hypothetical protein [Formosa agariphila]CDF80573.1 hypothetical protein BN863_28610 [Formosa agariphila KMM 3901]